MDTPTLTLDHPAGSSTAVAVGVPTRLVTGLTPSGRLHVGNYVGAIRPLLALAARPSTSAIVFVADLHAMTNDHDPTQLRSDTRELAATLLACGLGAEATFFLQSAVPAHTELAYLLECTAAYGEMTRMIQFKEKAGSERGAARLSLLTYPALMAADILLYRADAVPVGEDQRQHLELTRTLARRFNARYGDVFAVPEPVDAGGRRTPEGPAPALGEDGQVVGGIGHGAPARRPGAGRRNGTCGRHRPRPGARLRPGAAARGREPRRAARVRSRAGRRPRRWPASAEPGR